LKVEIFAKWLWLTGGGERVVVTLADALIRAGHHAIIDTLAPVDFSALTSAFGKDISPVELRVNGPYTTLFTKAPVIRRYVDLANEFAFRRTGDCDIYVDLSASSSLGATYPRLPEATYWTPPIDFRRYISQLLRDRIHRIVFDPYVSKLTTLLEKMNEVPLHFAASHYCEETIRQYYAGHFHAPIRVLYPPVNIKEWKPPGNQSERKGVVSLARFSSWKRHDLQLKIVGDDIPLTMVGGAKADEEKETVSDLEQRKTRNVRILLNQPLEVVKRELWGSKVFLHTADGEPAALAIVEATAAGNIPIVRNSGGSIELVGFPELTFTSVEEAREKVVKALAGDYDDYLPRLSAHIAQSDESVFCSTFINAIEQVYSRSH